MFNTLINITIMVILGNVIGMILLYIVSYIMVNKYARDNSKKKINIPSLTVIVSHKIYKESLVTQIKMYIILLIIVCIYYTTL